MKRVLFFAAVALSLVGLPALAWVPRGNVINQWLPLKIGGSGLSVHLSIADDGAMAVGSDQYGCYKLDVPAGVWVNMLTTDRMAAALNAGGSPINYTCDDVAVDPTHSNNIWMLANAQFGSIQLFSTNNSGNTVVLNTSYPAQTFGFAQKGSDPFIAIDPANSQVLYVASPSMGVYFSNDGATFANSLNSQISIPQPMTSPQSEAIKNTDTTTFASCSASMTFNNPTGGTNWGFTVGQSVQVWETSNPFNSMYGTVSADTTTSFTLSVTASAGDCAHSDWTVSLAFGTGTIHSSVNGGGSFIVFDPSSGTMTVGGQIRTAGVYICTFGVGIFHSTDGGQTFSALPNSNGSQYCQTMRVSIDGTVWVMENSNFSLRLGFADLRRYDGVSWTDITFNGISNGGMTGFTLDKNHCATPATCHIFVFAGAIMYESPVGGGLFPNSFKVQLPQQTLIADAGQPSWEIPVMASGFGIGAGSLPQFAPNGRVYFPGEGPYWVQPVSNTDSTLVTNCAGPTATFSNPAGGLPWKFEVGQGVSVFEISNSVNTMAGTVASVSGTSLTINVASHFGSCSHSDWLVGPTTFNVHVFTAGMEMSENTDIENSWTVSGAPIITAWDIGGFYKYPLNGYPNALIGTNPYSVSVILKHSYSVSFAPGTNIVAILADNQSSGSGIVNLSAISTQGGIPGTWTALSMPTSANCGGFQCEGGALCALSATNVLVMPAAPSVGSAIPQYTTNAGPSGTWTPISITGLANPTPTTGWPSRLFAYSNLTRPCSPSPTVAGKVAIYNYSTGDATHPGDAIIVCTSGGVSCSWVTHPNFAVVGRTDLNSWLKYAPNGDLWFTPGTQGSQPNTTAWYYSTDDFATVKRTVTGFENVTAFGFGATFPGMSYPTVVAWGWYTGTFTLNGVSQTAASPRPGTYACKNFNAGTGNCDSTWQQVGPSQYPYNWASAMINLDGDKIIPGMFQIISQYGGGFQVQFNYLLNRDLDPAANDNSPAFLNRVG